MKNNSKSKVSAVKALNPEEAQVEVIATEEVATPKLNKKRYRKPKTNRPPVEVVIDKKEDNELNPLQEVKLNWLQKKVIAFLKWYNS